MSRMDRRQVLGLGLAAWVGQGPALPIITERGVVSFRLVEPAGVARVGDPVSTTLPLAHRGGPFRLTLDGRPIPAQFRPVPAADGPFVAIDFAADLGPGETARYEVHHGLGLDVGPEPENGLALATTVDRFVITRNGEAAFEVDRDLAGLLRAVGSRRVAWLGETSPGPFVTLAGGGPIRAGVGTAPRYASRVFRQGPAAIALGCTAALAENLKIEWILTFPLGRNRVVVEARVAAPRETVEAVGFDLDLRFGSDPVTIERDPANPPRWARALQPRRQILVVADPPQSGHGRDQVEIAPSGRLSVLRRFADGTPNPTLRATIEFASESTPFETRPSPLALLRPIRVEWDRPPEAPDRT